MLAAVIWLLTCLLAGVLYAALRGAYRLRLKQPATKHKVIELAMDCWLGRWFVKKNWGGFTFPFPGFTVIFYWLLPKEQVDPLIRVHEFVHVRQAEEAGAIRDWYNYERESIEDGFAGRGFYDDNKYEQEAYKIEAEAAKHGLPDWAKT